MADDFEVRPLDAGTWPAFAALVERHNGVWGGCWCLGFHEEGAPGIRSPEERRACKQARVREGRAHATLVFDGDACVGWCQFGSPDELPRIKHRRAYEQGANASRTGASPASSWTGTTAATASPRQPSMAPSPRSPISGEERSRAIPKRSAADRYLPR